MGAIGDFVSFLGTVVVPLLIGVASPIIERDSGGRELRIIKKHPEIRAMIPDGSPASSNLDALLEYETSVLESNVRERLGREIDVATLFAMAIVAVLGGIISYGLAHWAQACSGLISFFLWFLFSVWVLFVILLVFAGGIPKMYKKKNEK